MGDTFRRLTALQQTGKNIDRYLSDSFTAPYQKSPSASGYFSGVGSEGVYVVQEGKSGPIKHAALVHRPHVDKQATHIATVINTLRQLHASQHLTLEEAIEAACIFGFCNSLDIYCTVMWEWTINGLPSVERGQCLADCFAGRANELFGGVQKSNATRCQAFIKPIKVRPWRSLVVSLCLKRKEWLKKRPFGHNGSKKEWKDAYLVLLKLIRNHSGVSIGVLKAGEVIHLLCGWRLIDLVELCHVCEPMFKPKKGCDREVFGTIEVKRSCQAALAIHYGKSEAVIENCTCECCRGYEPKGFHLPWDTFHCHTVVGCRATVHPYFPTTEVGVAIRLPVIQAFLPGLSRKPNFLWSQDVDFDIAIRGRADAIVVSKGTGIVQKYLLTPQFLGAQRLQEIRSLFFVQDPLSSWDHLTSYLQQVVSDMTVLQKETAMASLGSKKYSMTKSCGYSASSKKAAPQGKAPVKVVRGSQKNGWQAASPNPVPNAVSFSPTNTVRGRRSL